ncbi:hypothetical protein E8E13_010780 [Curvularia kusanoi]|uniref:RING-type domain-containing protein n=1 Tax=Curvularia kusanoi TaxID=90978 RepID=A0A9P4WD53_CURKU|nr:hypothetical protein E8E13_010780 [Curvularia kusanoi]
MGYFSSQRSFFKHGMQSITLSEPQDCTICREPLLFTPPGGTDGTMGDQSAPSNPRRSCSAAPAGNAEDSHEQAVRISPCNHVFGADCIRQWLETSNSRTCPMCRTELYPEPGRRRFKMKLAPPTREQRLGFARYIEYASARPEWAPAIRRCLMGEEVRRLMVMVLIEDREKMGYEANVEWIGDETMYDDEEGEDGLNDVSTDRSAWHAWYHHSRIR